MKIPEVHNLLYMNFRRIQQGAGEGRQVRRLLDSMQRVQNQVNTEGIPSAEDFPNQISEPAEQVVAKADPKRLLNII